MHPSCAGGRITGHWLTLASGPALCSGGGHWNKTSLTVRDTAHLTMVISQSGQQILSSAQRIMDLHDEVKIM